MKLVHCEEQTLNHSCLSLNSVLKTIGCDVTHPSYHLPPGQRVVMSCKYEIDRFMHENIRLPGVDAVVNIDHVTDYELYYVLATTR